MLAALSTDDIDIPQKSSNLAKDNPGLAPVCGTPTFEVPGALCHVPFLPNHTLPVVAFYKSTAHIIISSAVAATP